MAFIVIKVPRSWQPYTNRSNQFVLVNRTKRVSCTRDNAQLVSRFERKLTERFLAAFVVYCLAFSYVFSRFAIFSQLLFSPKIVRRREARSRGTEVKWWNIGTGVDREVIRSIERIVLRDWLRRGVENALYKHFRVVWVLCANLEGRFTPSITLFWEDIIMVLVLYV